MFLKLSSMSWGVLLLCGLSAGCMTSPYQDEVIGDSIHNSIWVAGFANHPNKTVTIQARAGGSGTWVTIATTTSKSYKCHWDGVDWYPWGRYVTVPATSWAPLFGAAGTHIRTRVNGLTVVTFESDFSDCWSPAMSKADLFVDCGSPHNYVRVFAVYD